MRNCKNWLCTILLCLGGVSLFAQAFSVKAGINRANLSDFRGDQYSSLIKTDPEISFHLATALELLLTQTYSVEGGLSYSGRAHSYNYPYSGDLSSQRESVSSRFYYLDIPIRLKSTYYQGSCEAYFFAGGYLGFGLHGKEDRTSVFSNGMEEKSQTPVFVKEGLFQRLDYGALAGGGVYFGPVFLELSYSLGLANVYAGEYSHDSVKNRWISLSVGYRFSSFFLKI
jgi:hypothetical protein